LYPLLTLITFVKRMQRKFHRYLYGLIGAILISIGYCFFTQLSASAPKYQAAVHDGLASSNRENFQTDRYKKGVHHHRESLKAYFPETDNENDDSGTDTNPANLIALLRNDLRNLNSYLCPGIFNHYTAVSLASLECRWPYKEALYIHYAVLRL